MYAAKMLVCCDLPFRCCPFVKFARSQSLHHPFQICVRASLLVIGSVSSGCTSRCLLESPSHATAMASRSFMRAFDTGEACGSSLSPLPRWCRSSGTSQTRACAALRGCSCPPHVTRPPHVTALAHPESAPGFADFSNRTAAMHRTSQPSHRPKTLRPFPPGRFRFDVYVHPRLLLLVSLSPHVLRHRASHQRCSHLHF